MFSWLETETSESFRGIHALYAIRTEQKTKDERRKINAAARLSNAPRSTVQASYNERLSLENDKDKDEEVIEGLLILIGVIYV